MKPYNRLARWVLVEHYPHTPAIYLVSGHHTRGAAERAQRTAEIEYDNAFDPSPECDQMIQAGDAIAWFPNHSRPTVHAECYEP